MYPNEFHAVWYTDLKSGNWIGIGIGYPKLRYWERQRANPSKNVNQNLSFFNTAVARYHHFDNAVMCYVVSSMYVVGIRIIMLF